MATANNARGFHVKGLTSFVLIIASVVMIVSGVLLYAGPHGPAARGWTFLWLGKGQWDGLHMTSALLFTIAALFHLIWNWGLLWGYLKNKAAAGLNLKLELAVALLVGVVFIGGTVLNVPPFSSFLQLRRTLGTMWSGPAGETPGGHGQGKGPGPAAGHGQGTGHGETAGQGHGAPGHGQP
jgi:hypothetical protein